MELVLILREFENNGLHLSKFFSLEETLSRYGSFRVKLKKIWILKTKSLVWVAEPMKGDFCGIGRLDTKRESAAKIDQCFISC